MIRNAVFLGISARSPAASIGTSRITNQCDKARPIHPHRGTVLTLTDYAANRSYCGILRLRNRQQRQYAFILRGTTTQVRNKIRKSSQMLQLLIYHRSRSTRRSICSSRAVSPRNPLT